MLDEREPVADFTADEMQRALRNRNKELLDRFVKLWWREFLGEPYRTDSLQRHGPSLRKDIEQC